MRCSRRAGSLTAAAVAATAGLLLYATVRAPAVQLGRLAFTPLDVAACGAVAVVLVGWARGSVDAQQLAGGNGTSAFLLLVPALIVFAVAVALRAAARARAARARPRRPPRADLAAPRRCVARAQSRATRRSWRRSSSRASGSRSSPSPTARRSSTASATRRRSPCRRRTSSPRISRSSCRCCTARRAASLPGTPTPVVRLSGNVPSGTTFGFLALPGTLAARRAGLAVRLRARVARVARPQADASPRRTAAAARSPPAASSRCP